MTTIPSPSSITDELQPGVADAERSLAAVEAQATRITADLIFAMRFDLLPDFLGDVYTGMAAKAAVGHRRSGADLADLRLVMAGVIAGRMAEAYARDSEHVSASHDFAAEVRAVLSNCWWW